MAIITLTTDFGLSDWFVGTMKGVILSLDPTCRLVDLTHDIPSGDTHAAAFALAAACRYFPKGTVHLVVVDPGVGGHRRALAVKTRHRFFVGPDNGVLSAALALENTIQARQLNPAVLNRAPLSATFHGRDLFAPAAAWLSLGKSFARLGSKITEWTTDNWPAPKRDGKAIAGEVLYVDRFGNAITNLPNTLLSPTPGTARIQIPGRTATIPVTSHYGAARKGRAVAVPGSAGFLEVAIHQGNAARRFKLKVGSRVRLKSS